MPRSAKIKGLPAAAPFEDCTCLIAQQSAVCILLSFKPPAEQHDEPICAARHRLKTAELKDTLVISQALIRSKIKVFKLLFIQILTLAC